MGSSGSHRNGYNSKWYNINVSAYYCCMILLITILCSNGIWVTKADDDNPTGVDYTSHTVEVRSLIPSTAQPHHICTPSPKAHRDGISVEVRHKHGPCSPLGWDESSSPSHVEILKHDEARVKSIRNRIRANSKSKSKSKSMQVGDRIRYDHQKKGPDLPAKSGSTIGSANFIVTLGFGTPKKDLSLEFDTGSDLTWTQCEPCVKSCYKQQEPILDPRLSSTYSNISCNSQLCSEVRSATSVTPGCSSSTCLYGIEYGDSSFTIGFLAKDTLSLGAHLVPNFLFGCGQDNQGLFQGSAGILGLGRDRFSVVSQTSTTYFSYCLPSKPTYTGHLTFGTPSTSYGKPGSMIQYTPLVTRSEDPSNYYLELQGISVGGHKLSISPSVFSAGGTLIDSGTVITRLPLDAYSALKTAFNKLMSKYPKAPSFQILDTCYDFTMYTTVTIPKISLFFSGGTHLDLGIAGILLGKDVSQVCLAFAGNTDPSDVGILGNIQQLTFDVVYDVGKSRIGFAPGGCL